MRHTGHEVYTIVSLVRFQVMRQISDRQPDSLHLAFKIQNITPQCLKFPACWLISNQFMHRAHLALYRL